VVAGLGGLERLDPEHSAKMIQHRGDMEIGVGIDTATGDTRDCSSSSTNVTPPDR
jgi:hypothetical protein